ncbi:hypothetical protein FXO38_24718 [Capsicum annuum]|nr:hypothetical protein FXO37_27074 [Capsicum annuum]KAF3635248.1 hypothetical protein FXO38_24718 [Capsicum annuum]
MNGNPLSNSNLSFFFHSNTQQGAAKKVLQVLQKPNVPTELQYKFALDLIMLDAYETVESWMTTKSLNPRKLIPAMMRYSSEPHAKSSGLSIKLPELLRNETHEVIKYLEYCVHRLQNEDPGIHNLLLSLYTKKEDESALLSFLECKFGKGQPGGPEFFYDPKYALRLCLKEKRMRACVHIYSMMSMHEEAVALALQKHSEALGRVYGQCVIQDGWEKDELCSVWRSSINVWRSNHQSDMSCIITRSTGLKGSHIKSRGPIYYKPTGNKQGHRDCLSTNNHYSTVLTLARSIYQNLRKNEKRCILTAYLQDHGDEPQPSEMPSYQLGSRRSRKARVEMKDSPDPSEDDRKSMSTARQGWSWKITHSSTSCLDCVYLEAEALLKIAALTLSGLLSEGFFIPCVSEFDGTLVDLEMVDPELAMAETDKVEDDEDLRKKLWLMIAKHAIEQEKGTKRENIRKAIAFLKETDDLLKIEDILPFFPDFALIDDFKASSTSVVASPRRHMATLPRLASPFAIGDMALTIDNTGDLVQADCVTFFSGGCSANTDTAMRLREL